MIPQRLGLLGAVGRHKMIFGSGTWAVARMPISELRYEKITAMGFSRFQRLPLMSAASGHQCGTHRRIARLTRLT